VFAAATIGVLIGIWIGREIEAGIYQDISNKANLPAECWEKIAAGAENLVRELEASGRPPGEAE
jgi:hypothetical protein